MARRLPDDLAAAFSELTSKRLIEASRAIGDDDELLAQAHDLGLALALALAEARSSPLERVHDHALNRARRGDFGSDVALDRALTLALDRALDRDLKRVRFLVAAVELDLDSNRDIVDRVHDLGLALDVAVRRDSDLGRALTLDRERGWDRADDTLDRIAGDDSSGTALWGAIRIQVWFEQIAVAWAVSVEDEFESPEAGHNSNVEGIALSGESGREADPPDDESALGPGASMGEIAHLVGLRSADFTPDRKTALKRLLEPLFTSIDHLEVGYRSDEGALERIRHAADGLRIQLFPIDGDEIADPYAAIRHGLTLAAYSSQLERQELPADDATLEALDTTDTSIADLRALDGSAADIDDVARVGQDVGALIDWHYQPEWLGSEDRFDDYLEQLKRREPSRFLDLQVELQNDIDAGINAAATLYDAAKTRWAEFADWAHERANEAFSIAIGWIRDSAAPAARRLSILLPGAGGGVAVGGFIGELVAGAAETGGVVGLIAGILALVATSKDARPKPEPKDGATDV